MLSSLITTIKGFFSSLKKDEVFKYLDYLFNHINNSLLPSFDTLIKSKNLDAVKKNKFFPMIYKAANIKASDNYKALEALKQIFVEISEQEGKIRKLVDDNIPNVITGKAMRMRDAAIMTVIRDITSMTSYTMDLLYYIIVDESVSDLPKIKFKRIKEGMATYVDLLNAYGKNFKKTIEDIKEVSDEVIEVKEDIDKNMALLEQVASNTGKLVNLPSRNFVGNPIYHFRMWLVDRAVNNYEALKIKREMIQLKIHELQLEQQGASDKDLRKQIEYYENKLSGIEYKIEKFESSHEEFEIDELPILKRTVTSEGLFDFFSSKDDNKTKQSPKFKDDKYEINFSLYQGESDCDIYDVVEYIIGANGDHDSSALNMSYEGSGLYDCIYDYFVEEEPYEGKNAASDLKYFFKENESKTLKKVIQVTNHKVNPYIITVPANKNDLITWFKNVYCLRENIEIAYEEAVKNNDKNGEVNPYREKRYQEILKIVDQIEKELEVGILKIYSKIVSQGKKVK